MNQLHKKRFDELSAQLQAVISSKYPYENAYGEQCEEIDSNALVEWSTKSRNLLSQACGRESEHYLLYLEKEKVIHLETNLETLMRIRAVFIAAKEDFEGGYLSSVRTLVQAEVFSSELEQAHTLFKSGYITAAAVIAGVVLETTLRELCDQNEIPHGKLNKMNADLTKAGVYNMLVQKQNTALADIRNSAAHGKPDEYGASDVEAMIRDVERFLAEYLK